MSLIECPGCGAEIDDVPAQRTSESFCPVCDFPVFFAAGPVVRVPAEDGSRERNPGVAGRARSVSLPCPSCGEPNRRDALHCLRCGAVLVPPPVEPVVEVVPEPEPVPEPASPQPSRWWRWFVAGIVVGVVVTLVVIAIIRWIVG